MLKIGTDCSGIGAAEEAMKNIGLPFSVEFACDKDPYARKTYLANHYCKKIFEEIINRKNAPYVDLYVAGFPCQAFSLAGNRKGFEDIRGTIFFHCGDYIRKRKPKVFILENVKGLLSHDRSKNSKNKIGKTFSTMLNVLAKTVNNQIEFPYYSDGLNYNVHYQVLNTKDFGLPQNRERVFIVGIREDLAGSFSFPGSVPLKLCLNDLLEKEVDEKYFLSPAVLQSIIHSPGEGLNFRIISNTKTGYQIAKEGDSVNYSFPTSKTKRGRVGNQISQTLDLKCQFAVVKNGRIRRLTPRECFRLHGFPDSFKFVVSETQLYRQSGNTISIPVIQAIIKNLLPVLTK